MYRLTKCLVTHVTFVWFLSTVNSAVSNKASSRCKSSATITTFKWFLSWMTSLVYCELFATSTTSATFCTLVFTTVNILVFTQSTRWCETFLTFSAWVQSLFSRVLSHVNGQRLFRCKPLLTHATHVWSSFLIIWTLNHITAINFCSDIHFIFACEHTSWKLVSLIRETYENLPATKSLPNNFFTNMFVKVCNNLY